MIAAIAGPLERARAERDTLLLLELLVRLGMERASFGAGAEAEAPLREALAIAEARDDTRSRLRALRWLVVAASNQGHADEAAGFAARQLQLARSVGDRYYEGWALVGLGWDATRRGDATGGAAQAAAAAEIFRGLDDAWSESWAQNALGIAQSAAGRYGAAMESFRRAAEQARAAGYLLVDAMARNNLGTLAYSLGDPSEGREQFRLARAATLRVGNPREAIFPAMNEALCLADLGRQDEAERLLDSLLAASRAGGYPDVEASVLVMRAELAGARERPREAAALYRRVLSRGTEVPLKNRAEAAIGLSQALARLDSLPAAMAQLESIGPALARAERSELRVLWWSSLGERLLEAGRMAEGLQALGRADRTADSLGLRGYRLRLLGRSARACRALGRTEEARRLLETAAAVWEAERGAPLDPEWRESRGAAGREIYTELADLWLRDAAPPGDAACASSARERFAFDHLQRFKARTLLERMRGPGEPPDPFASSPAAIALRDLQDTTLRPGELLLDMYAGPRLSLVFAVTPETLRVLRLPGDEELRPMLGSLRELLGTWPAEGDSVADLAAREAVGRMTGLLLGGVGDLASRARRVFVSPDGPLHLVPWEALAARLRHARPDDTLHVGSGAVTSAWSRVPSAGFLAELRRDRREPQGPEGIAYVLSLGAAGEPPTPGAAREIRWLRRRFREARPAGRIAGTPPKTEADRDSAASRSRPLREGKPLRVLHVAGHITIRDQNPWQSEIRQGRGVRDFVRAEEVARARLPAQLVFLSGCASAGGRSLFGEGVPGLASAFLVSGARAVVASLWPVEDEATSRLVARFYRELARGVAVDESLARARDGLRGEARTAHPFYWAGFVVIGDGAQTVPLPGRPIPRLPLVAAGAVLAILLAVRRLRRSRRP